MSNAEHYALEARIKEKIAAMPEPELRQALIRYIDGASVGAVTYLGLVVGAAKIVPVER